MVSPVRTGGGAAGPELPGAPAGAPAAAGAPPDGACGSAGVAASRMAPRTGMAEASRSRVMESFLSRAVGRPALDGLPCAGRPVLWLDGLCEAGGRAASDLG